MSDALSFLSGGGAAERLIRAKDWTSHPMGPPEHWPEVFKVALSLLLNSPESMILAWGPDLHFFFNETYFPLLGPRLSWAMGERFDRVWADAWNQAKPIIDEAMAGRSRRFIDLPWKLATDRGAADTWWTFSYSRILGPDGEPAGLLIVTNETTGRVLADRKTKAAEELLLRAQQAGGVGLFTIDVVADVVMTTPEYCRIYGIPPRDVVPLAEIEALVLPEDVPLVSSHEERRSGHMGQHAEYRIRRPDTGAVRWIARRADLESDAEGRPVRYPGVVRDVTEQRLQASELEALNHHLEEKVRQRTADRNALWQMSRDLLLRCSFEGVITAVNPAWTERLGWRTSELLGANLFDFVHPDDVAQTIEGAQELSEGQGHARFDNRYRHRDGGYRWISWSTRPGEGIINAVGRDVTQEKEQAATLAKVEEQLRQSQKMEAVGQLTGGLAHDFNNLLTGITGSLDLMKRRISQGRIDELGRYVDLAVSSADRAAALTHRLLAFSRRQTLDAKPTEVGRLVEDLKDLIRRTIGPSIALDIVAAPDTWTALVDPNQLENAILNLCINARDAMPDGGQITVETANRLVDAQGGRLRELEPGSYVVVNVTDTGTGMPADVVARAFEPFFTTKPLGMGTGLGLSMIYGFTKQSGGQVRIHSHPGQGTTVTLYLPRHDGERVRPIDPNREAAVPPRAEQGETVLVVDDEPAVRLLVGEVLADLGYTAIEAADGAGGLRILRSDMRVDLLVTDVGLPGGMNGRQVADAARVLRPGLKVLFITGYAETAAVSGAHLDAGMAVLTKPFAMDDLAHRIRVLIEA